MACYLTDGDKQRLQALAARISNRVERGWLAPGGAPSIDQTCRVGFCTESHRATEKNDCGGLDENRKVGILTNGSGVVEPAGHHSRVEEASSQRSNKRRPEVDPIVRFFTSTG